jgi:hypothetical protein
VCECEGDEMMDDDDDDIDCEKMTKTVLARVTVNVSLPTYALLLPTAVVAHELPAVVVKTREGFPSFEVQRDRTERRRNTPKSVPSTYPAALHTS